jgi:phosphoglycerate dehydrogenase-like enzyme
MAVLLLGFAPDVIDRATQDKISALAPDLRVVVTRDRGEIEAIVAEVEIAAGSFPPELLLQAPALRWYQQWGAGADWLLRYPEAADKDFTLTNASGVHSVQISEHIIGLSLMLGRRMHEAVRAQVRQEWWGAPGETMVELAGSTMLLVGVGAIGARTARIAAAMDMRVEGIRRDATQGVEGVAEMYGDDQLHERLPHADIVVLTVPLSAATKGMIGAAELDMMKPSAFLINIGRGGTIDEGALIEALQSKTIAGAGLDVFASEPLPADSPLWEMENVIITGHYSGASPHYNERAMAIFLDNLERYRSGTPLRNIVDKHAGY